MITLVCSKCSHEFGAALNQLRCPACDEGLVEPVSPNGRARPLATLSSIWDFAAILPPIPPEARVTLGEGGTPLLRMPRDGQARWVKWEGSGPTLSYKDRFNAVNISVARALGASGVALISTGNAGLSATAYGAAAGLPVRVVSTPAMPRIIRDQIIALGGELRLVDPAETHAELRRALGDGWLPGSRSVPAVDVTPFGCEGYKTIAYEIVGALGYAPAAVLAPVGGGDGIRGIARGFEEMYAAGTIARMPRLYGARTSSQLAPSIANDEVGKHATAAIERAGGALVQVSEAQMLAATRELARSGLVAEPASACAWAAAELVAANGSDDLVSVVTGHGVKWGGIGPASTH